MFLKILGEEFRGSPPGCGLSPISGGWRWWWWWHQLNTDL